MIKKPIFLSLFIFLISFEIAQAELLINGAGATFPYPLYVKWFDAYTKANPSAKINYQPIGSGGGIRQVSEQTVDFGATDTPMTDEELTRSKIPLLHFPSVIGAVVPVYNLPKIPSGLKLSRKGLSGIFLGTITQWNDPEIVRVNPGIPLPEKPILVVHRSDGSGTTAIFTDYLSKVNPDWQKKVGMGKSVKWPVGIGGKGSDGVTAMVKQLPFSIGYVEQNYAIRNKLMVGAVENKKGFYILADLKSMTAAAESIEMPADFRVSITDPLIAEAYPIASFTWLLIPKTGLNGEKKKTIVGLLQWILQEGQKQAPALDYAPLPKAVILLGKSALAQIQ